jgi:tetratricopeptide (TPR) repeat protein
VGDPVAAGIVARLNQPGGNVTGFALFEATLGGKWLELLSFGLDRDPLAAPERLEAAIEEALSRAERGASLPPELRARLVLVIDQLEELFTAVARDEANRFIDLVDRLARSGRIWVVATLRGDYFSHLDDFPKLSKLAETGLFRLAGPQPPEIAQMIRGPAKIGGIRFERHPLTDVPLESLILEEAAGDPASLPLLEFILNELWHRRSPDGLITYREYESLGRLSGGIARRAEDVAADLEKSEAPHVGAAVDAVLESLVTVTAPGAEPTAARVSHSAVANTPERARVVDRLIRERLLMIDTALGETEPMVRIAHERLIEHWQRLARIVAEGRRFLAIRARLKSDAEAWIQAGEVDDLLISSARRLDDGRELLKSKRDRLDPATLRFIECSLASADARRALESQREQERLQLELQRQQAVNALQSAALKTWRLKLAAVSAAFLLLLAGGTLWVQMERAHKDRDRAHNDSLNFRAEELEWQVDLELRDISNLATTKANRLIQRAAAKVEQEFQNLVQSAPDNLDIQRNQATVWETIGDKFEGDAKDHEAALSAYRKAQDIWRRLVDKTVELQQDSIRRRLALNLDMVGNTLDAAKRATDALVAYKEALAIARKLADSHPDKALWGLDAPQFSAKIGLLMQQQGDRKGALSAYEQAISSADRIVEAATKDEVAYCQCHIANWFDLIGELKFQDKNWPDALKAYEAAQAIRTRFHNEDPEDNSWEVRMALSLVKIATVKLAKGDAKNAIGEFEKGRTIMTRLGQEDEWGEWISQSSQRLRQNGITNPYMDRAANEMMGCKQPGPKQGRPSTPGRHTR